MSKPKLAIVIGSIRPNRFATHAAGWIERTATESAMFDVQVIDLKDYPMPIFAEEMSPAYAPSKDEARRNGRRRWPSSTPIFLPPQNTTGEPTAVLKNALDYAYKEWANKPVAFVGYGGVGGARAIEQLRLNAVELQMAPIRTAGHILFPTYLAVVKDGKKLADFDFLNQNATDMLDQLLWWANALKNARENSLSRAA